MAHITSLADGDTFQPMNVNFGLFPALPCRVWCGAAHRVPRLRMEVAHAEAQPGVDREPAWAGEKPGAAARGAGRDGALRRGADGGRGERREVGGAPEGVSIRMAGGLKGYCAGKMILPW